MIHKINRGLVVGKINLRIYPKLHKEPYNIMNGSEIETLGEFLRFGIASKTNFNIYQIHLKMLERQQKVKHESR